MAVSTQRNVRVGRQERRVRTRNALLDAAQRLWAERGIHGASLDDIAGAAGLTKGAVYSNFTGKTDLLLALLERCTADGGGLGRHWNGDNDEDRLLGQLLVEFWLYGMRDYSAGWRIADWYQSRRSELAERLERADCQTPPAQPKPPSALPEPPSALPGTPSALAETQPPLMETSSALTETSSASGVAAELGRPEMATASGASAGQEAAEPVSAQERAALAMALELGLALQQLLDPDRVPAGAYTSGMRLVLGTPTPTR